MKKFIALILVLTLSLFCFAACKKDKGNNDNNTEVEYSLALAVETSIGDDNKLSHYVAALVLDSSNKIVAARIDCIETTPSLTTDGSAINDVASVTSKVELGDNYKMNSGSFAKQTAAFEEHIKGKTAAEVAALDTTLVAGCTMPYSPYSFKAVVAKAFASNNKTTFKTSESFTLGVAATMSVSEGKASAYFAGTVVIGGKIAATIIDSCDVSFSVSNGEIVAGAYNGTKVELGDNYKMNSGSFAKQTAAFEEHIKGKTAAEVAALDTTLVAGCTMPYSPYSFKTVVGNSITNAR